MHIVCAKVRGQLPEIGFLTTMRVLGIEPTSPGLAAHTFSSLSHLTSPAPGPEMCSTSSLVPQCFIGRMVMTDLP